MLRALGGVPGVSQMTGIDVLEGEDICITGIWLFLSCFHLQPVQSPHGAVIWAEGMAPGDVPRPGSSASSPAPSRVQQGSTALRESDGHIPQC